MSKLLYEVLEHILKLYLKVPKECTYDDMWFLKLLGIQSGICWATEHIGISLFHQKDVFRDEFETIFNKTHNSEDYLCITPCHYVGPNMYEDCIAPRIVYLEKLLKQYENKQTSSSESAWYNQVQQRND